MNLHHIGIATENIEKTEEMLKYFGYIRRGLLPRILYKVFMCFFETSHCPAYRVNL